MRCPKCTHRLSGPLAVCPHCGSSIARRPTVNEITFTILFALLALIVAWLMLLNHSR
jgi:hypothetical protein